MTVGLSERAMLVTLSRSQWGGEKTDRPVSRELARQKQATLRSTRVVKKLLPPEALAPVQRATGEARATHYAYTLPWRDEGPRILRSAIYSEYIAKMREMKDACIAAEEEFYSKYDVHKKHGMDELGAMVDEEDYPSLDTLKAMFSFKLDVTPIPTGEDFRVDVPNADKIRQAIDNDTEAAAKAGLRAKLADAAKVIGHMSERLGAYRPGAPGERATGLFKDSLVENVRELAVMLPKLNVFEDPEIDTLAAEISEKLGCRTPEELRTEVLARRATKLDADDILERMAGYLS